MACVLTLQDACQSRVSTPGFPEDDAGAPAVPGRRSTRRGAEPGADVVEVALVLQGAQRHRPSRLLEHGRIRAVGEAEDDASAGPQKATGLVHEACMQSPPDRPARTRRPTPGPG
ncbi:hypothetical protein Ddc_24356 [Ditylenchus destructor]|nr:hypothetical protein Ddc_24356 [Ditylenchus destructor]